MGGPSAHGQKNKAHKAGRSAGPSARDKHRAKKDMQGGGGGSARRTSIKATSAATKAERALASKHARDAKRQQVLERRRREGAPLVVAVLPLSADADVEGLWRRLTAALVGTSGASDNDADAAALAAALGMRPHTAAVPARPKLRLTLLPPPADRADPLAYVDLARAADALLLAVAAGPRCEAVDAEGRLALQVLRAMGLPACFSAVLSGSSALAGGSGDGVDDMATDCGGGAGSSSGGAANMKERAAARKRAEKALSAVLSGDLKLLAADNAQDMQQLLRALADTQVAPPLWRRARPSLVVQHATFEPGAAAPEATAAAAAANGGDGAQAGVLRLFGYVRSAGLSANQLVTVPGAGDFSILAIEGPPDPSAPRAARHQQQQQRGGAAAAAAAAGGDDADMADASLPDHSTGAGAAGTSGGGGGGSGGGGGAATRVLAARDPARAEPLVRENAPDPLAGEQTWPTDEELRDAELAAARAAARRRRKLPPGTSDYQAAWIFDDMSGDEDYDEDEDEDEDEEDEEGKEHDGNNNGGGGDMQLAFDEDGGGAGGLSDGDDDPGTDGMALGDDSDDEDGDGGRRAAMLAEARARRAAEADDADFPDEVEVPEGVPARERFARYRGLKSLRSSPWDPREGTPADYERVFAFENFKRAAKRARAAALAATDGSDPHAVPPGTYVAVALEAVPAAAAARVLARVAAAANGAAPPLTAFGLLQHEAKLSVLNFSLRKEASYEDPIANKEELLFVTGVRVWRARPVLSGDDARADKFKVERFLHAGRGAVATVYAPIAYGPLPLLALKRRQQPAAASGGGSGGEGGGGGEDARSVAWRVAAAGALRSVDPDRVALKKIVLTGYPARVHKSKAVVRWMFHGPDDVRWFRPVELWTKRGRRGRIVEPLGTHGAFKARFDGPVQQRDAVCLSLYKRAFPKWPADPRAFAEA